ncbi:hypothetical protein FACS1894199_00940 [Bacteroidia bacterium]|nr:hypothetical protein FACS1894199_00940 [Bacteroidia bacterium]
MKNILKAWLKKNDLTADPNDSIAVVSSLGSINKKGLLDVIKADGLELSIETLDDVITRYNRYAARYAASGWNVDTGLVYLRPIITGPFYSKRVDPLKNSIYVCATQGIEIRKELKQTEIEILGEMPDVMSILQVINMYSKVADGTITRGHNVQVDGTYIRVIGEGATVGVYLENAEADSHVKFDAADIVVNDPGKLILLVPADLPEGLYRLKVVTQFTGGNKLLKNPREKVFDQILTVL